MAGMLVPRYWAEGRLRERTKTRQITVRRWGWSDDSQAKAQAHADARTREAFDRIRNGENLLRREGRVAYNGADGVPIREEVLSRHGETIVTRNSYGARCLNTPDVLFADIDFGEPKLPCAVILLGSILLGIVAALLTPRARGAVGIVAMLTSLVVVSWGAKIYARARAAAAGSPEERGRARIQRALETRPGWAVRVYRTPAGLRVLVIHQRFDPTSPEAANFFRDLDSDPIYVRMCLRQRCFRARVSPKPWRVGIPSHLRPRPGVWPIHPARLPLRETWVAAYEEASRGYASCRYLETLGTAAEDPGVAAVRELHDELSRALGSLPIA